MIKLINPVIFIAVGAILRLLPHMPNVAPIAAMALFGGVYLNKKYALIAPIAAMAFSDLFLGFNASSPMVYVGFLITGLIGLWLRNHKNFLSIIGATLSSSVIFYLLTNFNFWYVYPLYPKTFAGLIQSYIEALPFFRNSIFGDLFYTGVFFGSYEVIVRLFSQKQLSLRRVK